MKTRRWTVVGYWPSEHDICVYWVKAPDPKTAFERAAKQAARASGDEVVMLSVFRGHIKDHSTVAGGYGVAFRDGKEVGHP